MKKFSIFLFAIVAFLLIVPCFMQAQTPYGIQKKQNFGGSFEDYYTSVIKLADGNIIAVGYSWSGSFGGGDWVGINPIGSQYNSDLGIIVKYNPSTNAVADKNYFGGKSMDVVNSVVEVSDGFIVVGYSDYFSFGTGDFSSCTGHGSSDDATIYKLNSDLSVAWAKNFGGNDTDWFHSVTKTTDGNVVAVGFSSLSSFGNGDWTGYTAKSLFGHGDAIIVKFNASTGAVIWKNNYQANWANVGGGRSVVATPDGGVLIAGENSDYAFIVKYNQSGVQEWYKHLGDPGTNAFYSIIKSSDNSGYVTVGHSSSIGVGNWAGFTHNGGSFYGDATIVKYDNSGNVVWKKNFGGNGEDYFCSVTEVSDGYIAVGVSTNASFGNGDWLGISGKGGEDAIIVKYDLNGNLEWKKNFGANNKDEFKSIITMSNSPSNNNVLVVGSSNGFNNGDWTGISPKGSFDAIYIRYDQNVINTPEIVSVDPLTDITVCYGAALPSLPSLITVKDDEGISYPNVSVTWNTTSYNGNVADTYIFSGTFTAPVGTNNTGNITATIKVIVRPKITFSTAIPANMCAGDPITLNFTGDPNFTIGGTISSPLSGGFPIALSYLGIPDFTSTSATIDLASMLSITTPINFTINFTSLKDGNGCTTTLTGNSFTSTISPIPTTPTFSPTSDAICEGEPFNLPVIPNGTWTASGGATITSPFFPTTTDTYSVIVTQNNCSSSPSAPFSLTVNPIPAIPILHKYADAICSGITYDLTSLETGTTYTWILNGAIENTPDEVEIGGTYGAINIQNGCSSDTVDFVLTVSPTAVPPSLFLTSDITCVGSSPYNLTNLYNGTCTWTDGYGTIVSTTVPTTTATTYSFYAVIGQGICLDSTEFTLTINNPPSNPMLDHFLETICSGITYDLTSLETGTTYTWILNGTIITPNEVEIGGTYGAINIQNGCNSDTIDFVLTINQTPAAPSLLLNSDIVCVGSNSYDLTELYTSTCTWTDGYGTTVSTTIPTTTADTYSFYAVVEQNNCSDSTEFTLTINNPPSKPVLSTTTGAICAGSNFNLTSLETGTTYTWKDNGGIVITNPVTNAGTYIAINSVAGCTDSTTNFTLTVNPLPAIPQVSDLQSDCDETIVQLPSDPSWTWSNGSGITVTSAISAGNYIVVATVAGCTSSKTISVTFRTSPIIDSIALNANILSVVSGNSGLTYKWSTEETTETILISESGLYSVTVTNTDGCIDEASKNVILTNINENTISEISIYPNPSNGEFTINLTKIENAKHYEIIDAKGAIVKKAAIVNNNLTNVNINVMPGSYYIKIYTDNKIYVETLVIR